MKLARIEPFIAKEAVDSEAELVARELSIASAKIRPVADLNLTRPFAQRDYSQTEPQIIALADFAKRFHAQTKQLSSVKNFKIRNALAAYHRLEQIFLNKDITGTKFDRVA